MLYEVITPIIEKFGYTQKLKITNMDFNLDTYMVCRKDYIPLIEKYLREIKF